MASRFAPYYDDLWNCWCLLCVDLANAHVRHIPSALDTASEALFAALEAGVHVHQKPRVSLIRRPGRDHRNDGWQMREGLGIGVTPGGHMGSVRAWRQAYADTANRRTLNTNTPAA
ncbi:hypothetical protein ACH5AG_08570 [Streptomyces anulatus]